jgi:hypothetical protein
MILIMHSVSKDKCPVVRSVAMKTVKSWANSIGTGRTIMYGDSTNVFMLQFVKTHPEIPVVVLGDDAEQSMLKLGKRETNTYYKLPDPLPNNAFLKHQIQVDSLIIDCKQWTRNVANALSKGKANGNSKT